MLQHKFKIGLLFSLLIIVSTVYSQTLPIYFETDIVTSDFVDFDGGTATVMPNPQSNGINTSATVAQIVRNGGQVWAGSKIELETNIDFTTMNIIKMKVYTAAPIGTIVKLKFEGNGNTERDVSTTASNEWEELTWDFTGEPTNFNFIVFMFDFDNVGDGSATSTFLFDDIEQFFGGTQIDLPVDFEGSTVNYTMSDFGGNESTLVSDPTDPSNMVMQVIKTDEAATWAGTTIGTPAGFATNIPLTLTDSKMSIKIWSPESGTPMRLKVEDSNDPTHTCETETNSTVPGGWEVIEFDFLNQAPGTELLSVGLAQGWIYNMASVFFNFGTDGNTAGEETYYFDDVKFGVNAAGFNDIEISELSVFPNPSDNQWNISSDNDAITLIEVYDIRGELILKDNPNSRTAKIDASNLVTGVYLSKITTSSGISIVRLSRK